MMDDEDLKDGLKKSMSEPAKKRKPLVVKVFNPPREDDDTSQRDYEVRKMGIQIQQEPRMKRWAQEQPKQMVIERELPKVQPSFLKFECVYHTSHEATILHKGTAYCRTCYDERNRRGELIN